MCEFLPNKFRSYCLNCIWFAFAVGQSFTLILMMIYMPNYEEEESNKIFFALVFVTLLY